MKSRLTRSALFISVFAAGAACGWAAPAYLARSADGSTAAPMIEAPVSRGPIPLATAPNYRAIVAQNRAAVVGITADSRPDSPDANGISQSYSFGPDPFNGLFGSDPFFEFFRNLPMPHGNLRMRALGSGFIVSPDGIILTNAHVVRNAQRVTVKLADRREFRAKVLGTDNATDIAVLKIDAKDLPAVRLGDSNKLQVGDYVLAIGQPYGFEESASAGIVSAKGRTLPDDSSVPFIQTDVAVNPGNSGGPLFDERGAVVGINSQIYTTTGGYQGLSFAIPIDLALDVKDQIVAHGHVEHAQLGVEVQPLDSALAASFGLKTPVGALIAKVEPDSAAAGAGLKPGDIILSYDGQPVADAGDLSAKVAMDPPGKSVSLQVWRKDKALTLDAHLGSATRLAATNQGSEAVSDHGRLGLQIRPLSADERQQYGVAGGLLVQGVSGPAADAGIQPGDVLLSVDGTPVDSARQVRDIVDRNDRQVALLIQRGGESIFVPVELG